MKIVQIGEAGPVGANRNQRTPTCGPSAIGGAKQCSPRQHQSCRRIGARVVGIWEIGGRSWKIGFLDVYNG